MADSRKLIDYFNRILPLTEEEIAAILETLDIRKFEKGSLLLREGQISVAAYFVLEGCVRRYYLVDGDERTDNFFTEGQWVVAIKSMKESVPSNHFLECTEDSLLVVGNQQKEEALYKAWPRLETVSRKVMEKVFEEQQSRMAAYITDSPEQRYLSLLKNRPDLVQRIPQYQLASYIGVKPESLSRIRRRLLQK